MSSNGVTLNSTMLYLRPMVQPRFQIRNAAQWLVKSKRFNNFQKAIQYILHLEMYNTEQFKALMAAYYDATNYIEKYANTYDINNYRSSSSKCYGEDEHMWFKK